MTEATGFAISDVEWEGAEVQALVSFPEGAILAVFCNEGAADRFLEILMSILPSEDIQLFEDETTN